tara:strand:+ start:269 stop:1663 length:1395 start_codon:yes stop_codon:yes gene_type:complete
MQRPDLSVRFSVWNGRVFGRGGSLLVAVMSLLAAFLISSSIACLQIKPSPLDSSENPLVILVAAAANNAGGETWAVVNNPTSGADEIYDIALDGDDLFIAGSDSTPGNQQWRIEKRSAITGELDPAFGNNGVVTYNPSAADEAASSIYLSSSHIFVVGSDESPGDPQLHIQKRSRSTGALDPGFGTAGIITSNVGGINDTLVKITGDGTYIYVAGIDNDGGGMGAGGRVEKRLMSDGSLVGAFDGDGVVQSDPTVNFDNFTDVLFDGGFLYVCGGRFSGGSTAWWIEKRSATDGSLVGAFDGDGELTINPSAASGERIERSGCLINGGSLFLAGVDEAPGNRQWHLEKRDSTTAALDAGFGTSGVILENYTSGTDNITWLGFQGTSLLVAGDVSDGGGFTPWRLESRSLTTGALEWSVSGTPGYDTDLRTNATNGTHIFLGISTDEFGDRGWRIERRRLTDGSL